VVLDLAYAPLRLSGKSSFSRTDLAQVWQLFTPNKALGLTGVRAAYVIAPLHFEAQALALQALAPSWLVGAHGVAMLASWVQPEVQAWLVASLDTLRAWKVRQLSLLEHLGWTCLPSDANYFCARAPQTLDLSALRQTYGIKLRDAGSFGLPAWLRLAVLPPSAQDALGRALT
jgi:histidinol-phosphate aminotransferase